MSIGWVTLVVEAVFLSLKLAGAVTWNWLAVFAPLLAYVGLAAIVTIATLVVALSAARKIVREKKPTTRRSYV